jgi:hypothetical protein
MNRNYSIFILSLFLSLGLNAQRLKTEEIKDLSEKYLREAIGEDLFQYFEPTENISYYKLPANRFGFENSKLLKKDRRIRKNWTSILVFWHFSYPKVDGIRSGVWVKINKQLELYEPIELNFIPKFVWEKRACDFITIEEATEIGNQNLIKTKFDRTKPKLSFDNKRNEYIYTIINKLTSEKDIYGKERGMTEILEINALTGKPYELKQGYHGIRIR